MNKEKFYIFQKRFGLSLLFYITESIITAFLLSYYNYLSKPFIDFSNFEVISRFTFAIFIFRIITLQALSELLILYIIIRSKRFDNFWIISIGVIASILIWNYSLVLFFGGNPIEDDELLKAAFGGYGIPLFSGTLFAWWLCYKKIGLKI